jgi:hypothetical protein
VDAARAFIVAQDVRTGDPAPHNQRESGEFRLEWAIAQSTDNGSDVSPNTDLKFETIPATVGRGRERSLQPR